MEVSTKARLIDAGLAMLLERGYNHLGIQDVLAETDVPKGSFYHHFASKEEFALAVIDRYMVDVHAALDGVLLDPKVPPLRRIRTFFEAVSDRYRGDGYLGCLLGGLGQELSGVSDTFRARIEHCLSQIASKLARCLDEAKQRGEIDRKIDTTHYANLLVNCWEGAALRSRMRRDPAPLTAMLDFYFTAMKPKRGSRRP